VKPEAIKEAPIKKGFVRRSQKREMGLFIDGVGLDRAARRLNRRVDMAALVRGVTAGATPVIARYYTLIPFEDDSRHHAFLDAVARAGLQVVVKRLPPKGVNRQVSIDLEMATDMVAFALGHTNFNSEHDYKPQDGAVHALSANGGLANGNGVQHAGSALPGGLTLAKGTRAIGGGISAKATPTGTLIGTPLEVGIDETAKPEHSEVNATNVQRIVTVVCPSRDLSYPIGMVKELGIDTLSADFGKFNSGDVLKSAAKWIDLSDSETIWRT